MRAILPANMTTPDLPSDTPKQIDVPMKDELEARFKTTIITYEKRGVMCPGGQCGCCGTGPNGEPDWQSEPWYIYRAGICDGDGVYYSMLCEDCLETIRAENAKRIATERDETASDITELMGDDVDGAQTFMDDLQ